MFQELYTPVVNTPTKFSEQEVDGSSEFTGTSIDTDIHSTLKVTFQSVLKACT